MIKSTLIVNHSQIVKNLKIFIEKKYGSQKSKVYESLDKIENLTYEIAEIKKGVKFNIDPNLAVDLVLEIEKEEENEENIIEKAYYYTIFLVISTKKFPDTLEKRISFYQFYLSRIISSKRLEIILVAPDFNKKMKDVFDRENGLKENGIGFWEFSEDQKKPIIISHPESLRFLMHKQYEQEKPEDIPLFFDKYVHNAVNAIAGIKPDDFGKRYLTREILDQSFNLKKISYHEDLIDLINSHLTDKNDDYEFVNEAFTNLWKTHIGLFYPKLLKEFEPSLQNIFPDTGSEEDHVYRDHYLHQFQVFLLGLPIIDTFYSYFEKNDNPELIWLIASSAHDIGYPVQLYDSYSESFFKKFLGIGRNPNILEHELKSKFVEDDFLACAGFLICDLCNNHLNRSELKANWLEKENELIKFFFNEITVEKNHGLMSSISLLKILQNPENKSTIEKVLGNYDKAMKKYLLPAVLAIGLHDIHKWPMSFKKTCPQQKIVMETPCLKFENDPISFLLIFCDCVQEWGRPLKNQNKGKYEVGKGFFLKKMEISENVVKYTLATNEFSISNKKFQKKQKELDSIQYLLKPPKDLHFIIRLEDKENIGMDYEMKGHTQIFDKK
ncbi:MAG: hypothetical protein WCX22_01180 [Methanoregula sp.]